MGRRDESVIVSGTNGSTRTPGLIAVVSDDSAAPTAVTGSKRQTLAGMLRGEAEVITRLSGLTVIAKPVGAADDAAKLIEAIREMGAVGAIFLPGVEADRAQGTQRAVAEWAGPAVLTDQDATAIAVAASLLTALARADLDPASSRVVITGATTLPLLRPLLIAAGIGEIDSWNAVDAVGFGLKRLAYGADAVIDLIGRASHKLHFDQAQPIVISPGPRIDDRIAVPGLLTAILQCSARIIDVEAYHRCVLTLVAATPPGRLLPEPDSDLALAIADTAAAGLRRRYRSAAASQRGLG
jgi:hypothetical protein